jgi:hypothetical protein
LARLARYPIAANRKAEKDRQVEAGLRDTNGQAAKRVVRDPQTLQADRGEHERDVRDGDSPWLFVKRQEIIEESFPKINAGEAHELGLRTAGMVRPEIIEPVNVSGTGWRPNKVYRRGELSVRPKDEMVMERLLNPYGLTLDAPCL